MIVEKIPNSVSDFIEKYFHLNIKNLNIITPYFINQGGFLKSPVNAGKGTPEEIEQEANSRLKDGLNQAEILIDMHEMGLGIDCSGLVYQIYDFWLKNELNKGELRNYLPSVSILNIRKFLSRKLKPQNSMGADELTSKPFSQKIELKDARPGDLIRTRGGKHLLLITEVEKENDLVKRIKFVNSARQYKRDGLRYGEVFPDNYQNLSSAKWEDNDPTEPENYAYNGFRESINNNGIFRPNIPLLQD